VTDSTIQTYEWKIFSTEFNVSAEGKSKEALDLNVLFTPLHSVSEAPLAKFQKAIVLWTMKTT
jgi:hypothetical protein